MVYSTDPVLNGSYLSTTRIAPAMAQYIDPQTYPEFVTITRNKAEASVFQLAPPQEVFQQLPERSPYDFRVFPSPQTSSTAHYTNPEEGWSLKQFSGHNDVRRVTYIDQEVACGTGRDTSQEYRDDWNRSGWDRTVLVGYDHPDQHVGFTRMCLVSIEYIIPNGTNFVACAGPRGENTVVKYDDIHGSCTGTPIHLMVAYDE